MTPRASRLRTALTRATAASALLLALTACQPVRSVDASTGPEIVTRWDHRSESDEWNMAAMGALRAHGAPMLQMDLADAATFCPGYEEASPEERAAFWVAFMSGLARYESGHRPEAAGAGGRYRGLLQISPGTARFVGCDTSAEGGLYDGATNLSCAVRILSRAVQRDGVIATGRGGMAADWPPLRDPSKRSEIAAFTRSVPACQA